MKLIGIGGDVRVHGRYCACSRWHLDAFSKHGAAAFPKMGHMKTINRTRSRRAILIGEGSKDILPISIGYIPMALAIGGVIAASPLNPVAEWAGGPLISAGAAQLTLIEGLSVGGGFFAAIAAALAINARLVAYGAALTTWFGSAERRWKLLIGFFTIDVTYLLAEKRFRRADPGPHGRRWYFLGMGLTLYPTWSISMAVGVIAGSSVPDGLALEHAATFMMIGLLALALDTPTTRLAALVGSVVGFLNGVIPGHLAPLVAAIAALLVVNGQRSSEPTDRSHSSLPVGELT
jgi:predicted branched-subunit amino acid permease